MKKIKQIKSNVKKYGFNTNFTQQNKINYAKILTQLSTPIKPKGNAQHQEISLTLATLRLSKTNAKARKMQGHLQVHLHELCYKENVILWSSWGWGAETA